MVDAMNKDIGKRVRERRELLGYTREQFAEKLNISVRFAADIELGNKGMSMDTLIKICRLFSVSADYIIWGKEEKGHNGKGHNGVTGLVHGLDERETAYAEDIMRTFVRAVSDIKYDSLG